MESESICLEGVSMAYGPAGKAVKVLDGVNFQLNPGEVCVISGRSGCGKTTLLHVLGGLLHPTGGAVRWQGRSPGELGAAVDRLRGETFGFIFQNPCLLAELTALENVMMPWRSHGKGSFRAAKGRALELLEAVGLGDRGSASCEDLSGGEKQRLAAARAAMVRPKFLLADEPTGSLDSFAERAVVELLCGLCDRCRSGLLVVSHGNAFNHMAHRRLVLDGGRLIDESRRSAADFGDA
ncbi:MAG: ATP-binding cassette domain-containing protein [Puniceicoccales bacterium]|jgi:ABC-type lipoprotein export system ATPase subunit|nr:ATP-binding cassette domain-containing protein [Puniceicoccales bacterium]